MAMDTWNRMRSTQTDESDSGSAPHGGRAAPHERPPLALPLARPRQIYTPEYQRMLARLRTAREEAGLSQAAVAAHFGRWQSFVSNCESGERRIDPTELRRFAEVYDKTLEYFLEEES